jgi:hypothetical protein
VNILATGLLIPGSIFRNPWSRLPRSAGIARSVARLKRYSQNPRINLVDHITALSSVYFIKDFLELIRQLERIAHTSIVLSVEHFSPQMIKEINEKRRFEIFNHSAEAVKDPTEVIQNVFLWKRPESEERIFGDIVFRNLLP